MAAVEVTCPKCGVQWKGNLRPGGLAVTVGSNGPPSGSAVSALCLACEKEEV